MITAAIEITRIATKRPGAVIALVAEGDKNDVEIELAAFWAVLCADDHKHYFKKQIERECERHGIGANLVFRASTADLATGSTSGQTF